jgi:hypothetical protein
MQHKHHVHALYLGSLAIAFVLGGIFTGLISIPNFSNAAASNLTISGTITAGKFVGDGSGIINIKASEKPTRLSSPATIAALDCSGGAVSAEGVCKVPKGVEWKIPWAKTDFVLAKSSTVTLQIQAPIYMYPGNAAGCGSHIAVGFYVDGVRTSSDVWSNAPQGARYDAAGGSWWTTATTQQDVVVPAGAHTAQGYLYHWEGSSCSYVSAGVAGVFYIPRLFLTIWP